MNVSAMQARSEESEGPSSVERAADASRPKLLRTHPACTSNTPLKIRCRPVHVPALRQPASPAHNHPAQPQSQPHRQR
eukprot:363357-Chlamydomonas_euryale.AAC.12